MTDASIVQRDDIVKMAQAVLALCLQEPARRAAPVRKLRLLVVSDGKSSVLYDADSATRLGNVVSYRYEHDVHEVPRITLELFIEPGDIQFVTYQTVETGDLE